MGQTPRLLSSAFSQALGIFLVEVFLLLHQHWPYSPYFLSGHLGFLCPWFVAAKTNDWSAIAATIGGVGLLPIFKLTASFLLGFSIIMIRSS
jgi:hypothetical protein